MTRKMLIPTFAVALVGALAFAVPHAQAANASNPYGNVDKRNDKGNDTGDSQVEMLNSQQLNQNYRGQNFGTPMQQPPQGMPQQPPNAYYR
jgi:hypothetical protein